MSYHMNQELPSTNPQTIEENVIQEPTQQIQEPIEENLQQATQESDQKASEVQEEPVQRNFKELRLAKARLEKERDEAIRYAKEIEQRYSTNNKQEESEYLGVGESDLVEGKHLSKLQKQIKKLEGEIKNYQSQSTTMNVEARLKAQYPDFDKVVSKDNIELLSASYPELANSLNSTTDLYSKAVSAYTLIKKFGIDDSFSEEKERTHKNASKPRPLTSISPQQGDSPLSRANAFANGLTDELKLQLRKEMEDARKRM